MAKTSGVDFCRILYFQRIFYFGGSCHFCADTDTRMHFQPKGLFFCTARVPLSSHFWAKSAECLVPGFLLREHFCVPWTRCVPTVTQIPVRKPESRSTPGSVCRRSTFELQGEERGREGDQQKKQCCKMLSESWIPTKTQIENMIKPRRENLGQDGS